MSIKKIVSRMLQEQEDLKQSKLDAERKAQKQKHDELHRRLDLCNRILNMINPEKMFEEVKIEYLERKGVIREFIGIFEYYTDMGTDFYSNMIKIEYPLALLALEWNKNNINYGIFVGVEIERTYDKKDHPSIIVSTYHVESGNEAAQFINDWITHKNYFFKQISILKKDRWKKSNREIIQTTEQAIASAIVKHQNMGNL